MIIAEIRAFCSFYIARSHLVTETRFYTSFNCTVALSEIEKLKLNVIMTSVWR